MRYKSCEWCPRMPPNTSLERTSCAEREFTSRRMEGVGLKRFMAIYIGTATAAAKAAWSRLEPTERAELESKGMAAWGEWMARNADRITDAGAPLGKTKRASIDGISDTTNDLTAYVIVQAESHEAAAQMFYQHPHFAIFPGDSVEIMEILPMPGAS
jgi:hypothetical protein